ncbi:hypothetical protein [Kitasatospora sp. NPDC088346]|uniref:hypothetical protein n=1 Tax=Kitasatospora sp. NPDC088346 TaxID=3364073 RepID=UPI00380F2877
MVADGEDDTEGRGGEGGGDRPDHPPGRHTPGPQDAFWVAVLGLIVVVLFLVGLLSNLDMNNGPANQDWNTVWH